jgi:hypothetical protein
MSTRVSGITKRTIEALAQETIRNAFDGERDAQT